MAQMKTTYLTKEWYEKLLEEVRMLKEEKLPATLERLKEAISQWDISENAEYDTAMSERELIEARINEIQSILGDVEIIEHQEWWEIRYWSNVIIKDDKWREHAYTLVWTGEVDVLSNTISFESPLGHAIRGKVKGDKVQVKAPTKRYEVTIVDVK